MPDRRAAWTLIVLAIVARAAAVLVLQSHTVPQSTYEHGEIAANLLRGRGFAVKFLGTEGPTSQQAPVYPGLVAACYAVGGIATPRSLLILELGQAALGGLLVAGVYRLAGAIAPGSTWFARVAALLAAVHPTLVYAATHVQAANIATPLLVFSLLGAYRLARTGLVRDAVGVAAGFSLLVLTDPILGLAGAGVVWAVVARRGLAAAIRPLAVVAIGAGVGLLPWTVRNYRVHGELVAVKSTFGYAFWQGNCALSAGTDKVVRASVERVLNRSRSWLDPVALNRTLWEARHEAGYLDDIALSADDYRRLARVSEPERSRRLFRRALDDLRAEPSRYLQLCLRRFRYFLLFDETNPKTRSLVYRAGHLGLSALAVLGLLLARPETRWNLGPTLVTAALIAAFHSLTIVSARFHIPIEPLMALWAASGLTHWRRSRSTPAADDIDGVGVVIERGLARKAATQGGRALVVRESV